MCIKGECFWLGQLTTRWVHTIAEGKGNVWGTRGGRLSHLAGRATDGLMQNVNLLLWHRYTEACHNSPNITSGPETRGSGEGLLSSHLSLTSSYSLISNVKIGTSMPGWIKNQN